MGLSKKFWTIAMAGAMALSTSATAALAADVVVRYSNWLPGAYYMYKDIFVPWMEEVEKVTEGRVRFEVMPKFVGTVLGSYDVVADGLADASLIVPSYTAGRFVPAEGVELAWLGDDMTARGVAVWRAYEQFLKPAGVFKEVKVLIYTATPTAHIFTKNAPMKTIDDIAGVKLRSPGQMGGVFIDEIGATAVTKPISEVYELMSGGVIDGVVTNSVAMTGFKLDEVTKSYNYVTGGVLSTISMVAMNLDTWNKISPADQAAIEAISYEAVTRKGALVHAAATEASDAKFAAAGVEKNVLSDELLAELKNRTAPQTADWVARAKAAGMEDPQAMLDFMQKTYTEVLAE
jgi:TRAP-type C4-dicarboxylate transport system substrate-binding protein